MNMRLRALWRAYTLPTSAPCGYRPHRKWREIRRQRLNELAGVVPETQQREIGAPLAVRRPHQTMILRAVERLPGEYELAFSD